MEQNTRLCYNHRGVLKIADFCRSTESDALERSLWEMYHPGNGHNFIV